MNNSMSLLPEAVKLAKQSDVAIVVVGDNQDICQESWGGRSGDRASLVKHRLCCYFCPSV